MSKHEIINGWKTQNGKGGVAVRKACELIIQNPGIPQARLLEQITDFSNLNFSTAGWITSPCDKSPAGKLWERRKEGVFKCYPNEFTGLFVNASEHRQEMMRSWIEERLEGVDRSVRTGDYVRFNRGPDWAPHPTKGIMVGWIREYIDRGDQPITSPIHSTIQEAIDTLWEGAFHAKIYPLIIQDGETQPHHECYPETIKVIQRSKA